MSKYIIKIFAFILSFCLLFEQSGFAQVAGQVDLSGHFASLIQSVRQSDVFRPLHLRYLSYNNQTNNFKLLLDKGNWVVATSSLRGSEATEAISKSRIASPRQGEARNDRITLESETKALFQYFLIGVSLPNEAFWVNLRPDSPDSIIDKDLAKTDIGKIFLESDLKLKKDTALATSPSTSEGKKYWDLLYKKANELFATQAVTIPTLTRPWIVPDEIIIRVSAEGAYIYKATLKVMLEADYLGGQGTDVRAQDYSFSDARLKELNQYSSQLIKELIIPGLNKKINTSKEYAPLRQVYYSLILAKWFKANYYGKGGTYSWLVDRKQLNGLTSNQPVDIQNYFKQYQASFKDGEYNQQEQIKTLQGQNIRSYFSGGIALGNEIAPAMAAGAVSSSPARALPETAHNIGIEIKGSSAASPAEVELKIITQPIGAEQSQAASSPVIQSDSSLDTQTENYSLYGRFVTSMKRNLWAVMLVISMINPFINPLLGAQQLDVSNKQPATEMTKTITDSKTVPFLKRLFYMYIATMVSHGFHEQAHAGKYGSVKFAPWEITSGNYEKPLSLFLPPTQPAEILIANPLAVQIDKDIDSNEELRKIWDQGKLFQDKYAAGLITLEELDQEYNKVQQAFTDYLGQYLLSKYGLTWEQYRDLPSSLDPAYESFLKDWERKTKEYHRFVRWFNLVSASDGLRETRRIYNWLDPVNLLATVNTAEDAVEYASLGMSFGLDPQLQLLMMLTKVKSWGLGDHSGGNDIKSIGEFSGLSVPSIATAVILDGISRRGELGLYQKIIQGRLVDIQEIKKQARSILQKRQRGLKFEFNGNEISLGLPLSRDSRISLKGGIYNPFFGPQVGAVFQFRFNGLSKKGRSSSTGPSGSGSSPVGYGPGKDPLAAPLIGQEQARRRQSVALETPQKPKKAPVSLWRQAATIAGLLGVFLTQHIGLNRSKPVNSPLPERKISGRQEAPQPQKINLDRFLSAHNFADARSLPRLKAYLSGASSFASPEALLIRLARKKGYALNVASAQRIVGVCRNLDVPVSHIIATIIMETGLMDRAKTNLETNKENEPNKYYGPGRFRAKTAASLLKQARKISRLNGLGVVRGNFNPDDLEQQLFLITFSTYLNKYPRQPDWNNSASRMRPRAVFKGIRILKEDSLSAEAVLNGLSAGARQDLLGVAETGGCIEEFLIPNPPPQNHFQLPRSEMAADGASSPVEQTAEANPDRFWMYVRRTPSKTGGIDSSASLSIDSPTGKPGGIDLRSLPIVAQPDLGVGFSLRSGLPLAVVPSSGREVSLAGTIPVGDLEKEWASLQKMLAAGMIPCAERLKIYLYSCGQKSGAGAEFDKVLSCVAEIFRMEEEQAVSTEQDLKELLVMLESK